MCLRSLRLLLRPGFMHGDTHDQKGSIVHWQVVSVSGCLGIFILAHWKSEVLATSTQTTEKIRLKSLTIGF